MLLIGALAVLINSSVILFINNYKGEGAHGWDSMATDIAFTLG